MFFCVLRQPVLLPTIATPSQGLGRLQSEGQVRLEEDVEVARYHVVPRRNFSASFFPSFTCLELCCEVVSETVAWHKVNSRQRQRLFLQAKEAN